MHRFKRMAVLAALLLFIAPAWARGDNAEQERPNAVDDARIARLIKQLGNDKYTEREEAGKALEAIGKPALKTLREARSGSEDAEVRRRAQHLVERIDETDPEQLSVASEVTKLGGRIQ